MSYPDNVFDLGNLKRAYRWIMANPEGQYKAYFRDSYEAFAIASDTHIKWIRQEGLKERYECSHASKILTPKQSGILRPITLITVTDQIVYQACVNLIAEALKKKTWKRYDKRVFAHLYAGKTSTFFYKRWQTSYNKFGSAIKRSYDNGYEFIADFDLTAFYDSIDHQVLNHFLTTLGVESELIDFLMACLRHWTSSTWSVGPANIYHGHGIPQGPLSSGMLSEAVLLHLDEAGEQGTKTVYLRYVDDIKILAKTEDELRRKLIKLDIAAKEIGLFPQTSKINIHKIQDPAEETKVVSKFISRFPRSKADQKKLVNSIMRITKGGRLNIQDSTQFKMLIASIDPTHKLNSRLIEIVKHRPDLALTICFYIEKYKIIPKKFATEIVAVICERPELYHSVSGALLNASLGRISGGQGTYLSKFCADRLLRPRKGFISPQPTYKDALVAWSLKTRTLSYVEFEELLFNEPDWWVQKSMIRQFSTNLFGRGTYVDLTNRMLRLENEEICRIASARVVEEALPVEKPHGNIETTAKQTLKAAGILKTSTQVENRINKILSYVLNRKETSYEWKQFFKKSHRHAELMAIGLKKNKESNIDAFIVQMDSYCDFMTEHIWKKLKPTKSYPSYGHAIKDPTLNAKLPNTMKAFTHLHNLRLESVTAHPRTLKTGMPTRRLKHKDFFGIRQYLINAFNEFEATMVP